jgi:transcriptional regulator with XRE-family HTH domain
MMNQQKRIILAIRERREHLCYSQEYLAAKLNISQNSYSKTELATVKLTMSRFFKICEVLELSPVTLLNHHHNHEL